MRFILPRVWKMIVFLYACSAHAQGQPPPSTVIERLLEPGLAQVERARSLLDSLVSLQDMDRKIYSDILHEVRGSLKKTWGSQLFHAKFLCGAHEAFSPRDSDFLCRDLLPAGICFMGSIEEAVNLLESALSQGFWHWEEQWIERPQASRDALVVDWIRTNGADVQKVVIHPCQPS